MRPAGFASMSKGVLAAASLAANTLLVCACMMPPALVKLVVPFAPVRRIADRALNALASAWIRVNGAWIAGVGRIRWEVDGLEGLDPRRWYLLGVNHQSWVDIFVLQKVLSGRVPLLKFFLKRELIYVPFIGLAWWALDFPFLRRRGGAQAGRDDLEATRRSCERFKSIPTSLINFAEGTRFTRAKARAQRSPYRHLLKPKAGGMAMALATMGEHFDALLDVTIFYPGGVPSFWDLLGGRLREVVVHVRELPLPAEFTQPESANDPAFRGAVHSWMQGLWADKDQRIEDLVQARALGRV